MTPKIYLETTIPSYLAARPSRDLIKVAHQEATREWWETRSKFEIYVSQVVLSECGSGDPEAAAQRLATLVDVTVLDITEEAQTVARDLVEQGPIPEKAAVDALHIAVAAVHGMDYLLTWNCTHIANAATRGEIEIVCRSHEMEPPVICTPIELMEV